MVVPLRSRGRTHGVITLATSTSDRRYDESDLAFAVELARRAATAVDTARLYQDRDQVARTLQRTLLPPSLPDIPCAEIAAVYHPAGEGSEIGGDFYDAFETGDGGWAIAIGDVCGKGPAAAAITGLARHTLRAAAFREPSPRAVLERLNQALLREVREESFCTVAVARLSQHRRGALLTACAGGHPAPLILRPDGSIEEATSPGTLLGIYHEISVTDRESVLTPGESVVFYTDGVTEERRHGEQFGEERLRELLSGCGGLSATGIAERIERAVLQFQPVAPADDLAVLVIRIAERD
jgi:serine phosphatase RsbU (regulator of sigma subunit)